MAAISLNFGFQDREEVGCSLETGSIEDRQLNYDDVTPTRCPKIVKIRTVINSLHPFSELPFYFILFCTLSPLAL